jgi:hypothetical protein
VAPFCGEYFPRAICFRLDAMLEERALKVAMRDRRVSGQSNSNLRLLPNSTNGLPVIVALAMGAVFTPVLAKLEVVLFDLLHPGWCDGVLQNSEREWVKAWR